MAALAAHVHQAPASPSTRSELSIPPELDRLVLRCLAKQPAERPRIQELAQALAEVPVEPWQQGAAQRWWREHRPETAGSSARERLAS